MKIKRLKIIKTISVALSISLATTFSGCTFVTKREAEIIRENDEKLMTVTKELEEANDKICLLENELNETKEKLDIKTKILENALDELGKTREQLNELLNEQAEEDEILYDSEDADYQENEYSDELILKKIY